ncbi:MAG: hypothetical protein IKC60_05410 [Clostridia bacterium]|nr:hypothetical protein [Clostridia bacterium]
MKEKKKEKFQDDGRTVYSMEGVDEIRPRFTRKYFRKTSTDVTRKERGAVIRAALAHYMPIVFGVILCFAVTGLLLYFWLH